VSIVPGRDVPAVPEEWVDAVNKRINDENHDDLCACDGWPDACRHYKPGLWDLGVSLDIAVGVLEPLIRERIAPELALARSLRLEWPSIREAVNPDVHTPARTVAYLAAHGWVKDHERRGGEDWHDQPHRDGRAHWVFVPLDTSFADWDKRMAVLVRDLADMRDVGELQVLADIAEAGDE
jgi:hypothetical protein